MIFCRHSEEFDFEMSLLVISEILWLFINTLTADEKYSFRNRENLLPAIQMILSKKQKIFNQFLAAFLKFTSNIYMKDVVSLMSKHPVLEHPSTVTMSKGDPFSIYKECWNLHENTFIMLLYHSEKDWVRKSLSYWYFKSWDCLFTHWRPMTSILFVIVEIYCSQSKCNYLRNRKYFLNISLQFWSLHQIWNILKKQMSVIDYVYPKLKTAKDAVS